MRPLLSGTLHGPTDNASGCNRRTLGVGLLTRLSPLSFESACRNICLKFACSGYEPRRQKPQLGKTLLPKYVEKDSAFLAGESDRRSPDGYGIGDGDMDP